jgi:hypothetical protein
MSKRSALQRTCFISVVISYHKHFLSRERLLEANGSAELGILAAFPETPHQQEARAAWNKMSGAANH